MRGIQKLFDGRGARTERGIFGEAVGIDRGSVAQGVDAGDAEGKLAPLLADEAGQGTADVAVADEREFQSTILAESAARVILRLPMPEPIRIFVTGGTVVGGDPGCRAGQRPQQQPAEPDLGDERRLLPQRGHRLDALGVDGLRRGKVAVVERGGDRRGHRRGIITVPSRCHEGRSAVTRSR